jgi:hypothetical protein
MHGIPLDLDLTAIVGGFLTQICLGKYDVQFKFTNTTDAEYVAIHCQCRVVVLVGDTVISEWDDNYQWTSTAFMNILNLDVISYSVPDKTLLEIKFQDDYILKLYDDSEQYESMQIYEKGRPDIII